MPDPVRLRQICLVSQDLEWTSNMLCNAFDAVVVFQDPHSKSLISLLPAAPCSLAPPAPCSLLCSLLPAPTLLR